MSAPEGTYSSLLKGPAAQSVARLRAYKPAVDQSFFPRAVGDSRAAVLVALTVATTYSDPNAELQVLLTVRSSKLNTFPSEVALPGGKADGDENPVENAVREGFEEVGIEGKKMEVLSPSGWMCGHVSRNGLLVVPVPVLIPPIPELDLQLNPAEVDRVFFVPLSHFLDPAFHSTEKTPNSAARHRFDLEKYQQPPTFGLTAHILVHVAIESAGCRGDTMPDDGRPVFKHYTTFGSEPCDAEKWAGVLKMNLRRKKKGVAFHEEDKKRQMRDWGRVMGDAGNGDGEKSRI